MCCTTWSDSPQTVATAVSTNDQAQCEWLEWSTDQHVQPGGDDAGQRGGLEDEATAVDHKADNTLSSCCWLLLHLTFQRIH